MKTAHILFTASVALAMAFTFSCSSKDDGDSPFVPGGEGGETTESYAYTKTDNSFTYTRTSAPDYRCIDEGIVEKKIESYPRTIDYSISSNIMVWTIGSDTLKFSGTSSDLVGTWTRTKSECTATDYSPVEMNCQTGYDITKVEITASSIKITSDGCDTDWFADGGVSSNGVKFNVIDCNTFKESKGTDEVTVKISATGNELIYKGKTCSQKDVSAYTDSQRDQACKKAWDEREGNRDWEDNFRRFLRGNEFYECLENLPEWFK
jgi:hypothetical protein